MAGCSGMDSQISVPMATIFAVVRAVSKRRRAKACPLWCWMTCESDEDTKTKDRHAVHHHHRHTNKHDEPESEAAIRPAEPIAHGCKRS